MSGAQVLTSVVILSNVVSTSSGKQKEMAYGLPLEREFDREEEAVKSQLGIHHSHSDASLKGRP